MCDKSFILCELSTRYLDHLEINRKSLQVDLPAQWIVHREKLSDSGPSSYCKLKHYVFVWQRYGTSGEVALSFLRVPVNNRQTSLS